MSTSQSNLKNLNKRAILDLIRFTPGGIPRAELARRMNLSRSAVTTIVNGLVSARVVLEAESSPTSTSGRRPIMLEIDPGRGLVAGVDLGATHLLVAVADLGARVLHEVEVPFDITLGPQAGLQIIDDQLHALLVRAGIDPQRILAVGVGVPGPVSEDYGAVVAPPIMPGWHNFPIQAELRQRWDCPVTLNNDAELGALGEWAFGAGRGAANLAYIKVGSGVGAGLVLNGQIYRGADGMAGEIGHVTLQENGPLCSCGNFGCLEALAGGRAIARQGQEAAASSQRTLLSAVRPLKDLTARDVAMAAQRGDLVAQRIIAQAGEYLGIAISSLINLLNPGIVVVGGGVAQTGDLLLDPIRQTVAKRSLKAAVQTVRINTALLRRRSSCMGAVVEASTVVLHSMTEHLAF